MSKMLSQKFSKNVYSQFGEDGLLEEILTRISTVAQLDNHCCEFGAWDGLHFSNTANLIRNRNYSAVLIEASTRRFEDLKINFPQNQVRKLNKFVNVQGADSLDSILSKTKIPINFDFLSIDIDGCDYYIFESLQIYSPKILAIEYNPTIPNEVFFVQEMNFHINQGASAFAIFQLAVNKGYSLIAATDGNLIFVQNRFADLFTDGESLCLDDLRDDTKKKNFVFSGYDGKIFFSQGNSVYLPWHDIGRKGSNLQILPSYLRKFPGNYNRIQVRIYRIFRWLFSFKP